jgi:6-phosphofructokinase 1
VLEERLGEDTRVTSLGHVQRGGSPSAFDRNLSTVVGYAAVQQLLSSPDGEPRLIGLRGSEITSSPLMECVSETKAVAGHIREHDYETAMEMRGGSFRGSFRMMRTMVRAQPHAPEPGQRKLRLAILHAGGPAPGMNTAARVAVRVGIDKGHTMLAVHNGFDGLGNGAIDEMHWMSVNGWVSRGGAELGTSRYVPDEAAIERIAGQIETHEIDGLLMIGGFAGYEGAFALYSERDLHPALATPIVCLPASINNDLPRSEFSIGTDTALNSIVADVDKIKRSAVAVKRSFVVEVMGRDCGYLAMMSGLATGAERVYLPEEGITLGDLENDVRELKAGFAGGKRLGLVIRSERADPVLTSRFITSLFEQEGKGLFDAREAILGHVQQGGNPSPFDRIQATRLASVATTYLIDEALSDAPTSAFIGLRRGKMEFTPLADFPALVEPGLHRPVDQGWLALQSLARVMAHPETSQG